jgi:hypothetical protein
MSRYWAALPRRPDYCSDGRILAGDGYGRTGDFRKQRATGPHHHRTIRTIWAPADAARFWRDQVWKRGGGPENVGRHDRVNRIL